MALALAFAREFWIRQRYILAPALAYLAALVVLVHAAPAGSLDPRVVGQLALPLICVIPSALAVFSYGDKADVLARESGYPRRAFTLPLPATALVGWPMALGAATLAGFWLVTGGLVLRAVGLPVPLLWPALFAAGLLAWTQAIMWLPLPLTVLRVLLIVPVLSGLVAAAILGAAYHVSPLLLAAGSAALVPPAYLLAIFGVARPRCGDIPIRRWPIFERAAADCVVQRLPFASAAAALMWLEWRGNLYLWPLFALTVFVPLVLLLFLVSKVGTPGVSLPGLASFPVMMALMTGGSLANCHSWKRNEPAIPAFLAARPVTSNALLAVKLRGTVYTTLGSWGLIGLALAVALPFSPAGALVADWLRALLVSQGTLRGTVWLVLLAIGLPAITWKMTADQLWIGLLGRYWMVVLACIGVPTLITALVLVAARASTHPSFRDGLLAAAPWFVGTALVLKLALGGLVAWGLLRRELIALRTVVWFAAGWIATAAGLIALAQWLISPDASPLVMGVLAVVLVMPLVRLGLAPLALDSNRHR